MFGWLKSLFTSAKRFHVPLRWKYDAAQTTAENAGHWSNADSLSARSANSLDVRKKLRERARYEVANNCYARGITLKLANDMIGVGPKLQVILDDPDQSRAVEKAWLSWAKAVNLAEKLRIMKLSKTVDGEAFGIFFSNPTIINPVQLDLRLVECDQITTPYTFSDVSVDGIELDEYGQPKIYHVAKTHPGNTSYIFNPFEADRYKAAAVLHWFRADRPGQYRGIPEITPALPLFSQLRRYTLAVLTSAETAASFAAMLESEASPDVDYEAGTPFVTSEIERGMMTMLPAGWKMAQLKAEQPTSTYDQFVLRLLKEIGSCLCLPANVSTGDSAPFNFSSARLDHLIYRSSVRVERSHCEQVVIERVFGAWLEEATRIPGLPASALPAYAGAIPHEWVWPGWAHIDPRSEAMAETESLRNQTASLSDICGERGEDWEEKLLQIARENVKREELGLPSPLLAPQPNGTGTEKEVSNEA